MELTKSEEALLGKFVNGEIKERVEIKSFIGTVKALAKEKKEPILKWLANEAKKIAETAPRQCNRCMKISELSDILQITCEEHVIRVQSLCAVFEILSKIRKYSDSDACIGDEILERIDPDRGADGLTEDIKKLISQMSEREKTEFVAYLKRKIAPKEDEKQKLVSFEELLKMFEKK